MSCGIIQLLNVMLKSHAIILSLCSMLVVSCSTSIAPPDAAQVAAAERAQKRPSVAQAEAAIKEMAYSTYKDPESLKLRATSVHEFGIATPSGVVGAGGLIAGYKITTNLDAKNGNGAYNGYKPYEFIYTNGRVTETLGWSLTDRLTWYPWRKYTFYPKQELDRIRANGGNLAGSPVM